MNDLEDFTMGCVGCLLGLVVALIAIVIGGLILDGAYFGRRAFVATTACESKMREARRKTFSTDVVCIPIKARQDTTTVNLNSKQATP